jgi:hypothetical protein
MTGPGCSRGARAEPVGATAKPFKQTVGLGRRGSCPDDAMSLDVDEVARMRNALKESAGSWSDETHPELATLDDVRRYVRGLRAGLESSRSSPPAPTRR